MNVLRDACQCLWSVEGCWDSGQTAHKPSWAKHAGFFLEKSHPLGQTLPSASQFFSATFLLTEQPSLAPATSFSSKTPFLSLPCSRDGQSQPFWSQRPKRKGFLESGAAAGSLQGGRPAGTCILPLLPLCCRPAWSTDAVLGAEELPW